MDKYEITNKFYKDKDYKYEYENTEGEIELTITKNPTELAFCGTPITPIYVIKC